MTAGLDNGLIREDFFVTVEPGVNLFVREIRPVPVSGVPVVLVHGARVPGLPSFDLRVPGGSLAEDVAHGGHPTYVIDARGYGQSTRPPAMSEPPRPAPPLTRSNEVVRDLIGVIDEVCRRTQLRQVALVGWATGGMWVGHYASLYPERVSHIVFYNALYGGHDGHAMLGRGSPNEDPEHPGRFNVTAIKSYRLNEAGALTPVWDKSIPADDARTWRDPRVLEAYVEAALDSDSTSSDRTPPSFRAPSGALEDSFLLACGQHVFHASTITGKVLIIRGERDFWSRPEDAARLEADLHRAASVDSVLIRGGTHFVHLERDASGRAQFLSELSSFLAG